MAFGQSFIFGGNADAPTYEALQRKRKIADLLAAQSTQRPAQNMGEGIGQMGQMLASILMDKKLGPKEQGERDRIAGILGGLGSGSTVMGMPIGGAPTGFTGMGFGGGQPSTPGMLLSRVPPGVPNSLS